jgi:hypothetical protein
MGISRISLGIKFFYPSEKLLDIHSTGKICRAKRNNHCDHSPFGAAGIGQSEFAVFFDQITFKPPVICAHAVEIFW